MLVQVAHREPDGAIERHWSKAKWQKGVRRNREKPCLWDIIGLMPDIKDNGDAMDIGTVHSVDIDQQVRSAYLDYAMSVIVARALPDARDGLKPVHRRILYATPDIGRPAASPYRKSA